MTLREQIIQEIARLEHELSLAREHLVRIDVLAQEKVQLQDNDMEERSLWTSTGFKKFMMPKVRAL